MASIEAPGAAKTPKYDSDQQRAISTAWHDGYSSGADYIGLCHHLMREAQDALKNGTPKARQYEVWQKIEDHFHRLY